MVACPAFGRVLIVKPEPWVTAAVGKAIVFSYAAIAAMRLLFADALKTRLPPPAAAITDADAELVDDALPPEFVAVSVIVRVFPTSPATGV
jgi:hypothetical protein